MFGQMKKSFYLCRIAWLVPSGTAGDLTIEKDVFQRLSCWNINFAKVKTITDGATRRLRRVRCHGASLMGLPSVRHYNDIRTGVGLLALLILMVEAMRRPMFPG